MGGKYSETFWFSTVVRCVRCCPLDIRESEIRGRSELWMPGIKLLAFLSVCCALHCISILKSQLRVGRDESEDLYDHLPCSPVSPEIHQMAESTGKGDVKLSVYFPF